MNTNITPQNLILTRFRTLLSFLEKSMRISCKQQSLLINILKEKCRTIKQIQQVHAQAISRGLLSLQPTPLFTQILHSCNFSQLSSIQIQYISKVFNLIPNPSTFHYNIMIRACSIPFTPQTGLKFFNKMRQESIPLDFHTYPFVIKACGCLQNGLSLTKTLHSEVVKFGFLDDVFVCNSLVCIYCKNGEIELAFKVFDESLYRDVVTYNVMIDGFVKTGEIDKAQVLFDKMPERDAVSWGTLLAGYAKMNRCEEVIQLFDHMVAFKVKFDNVALVSMLSACAQLGEIDKGKMVHEYIGKNGIRIDSYLGTGLVDMHAKCGCIEIALEVFESCGKKNVPLWNAMLVGLAIHGRGNLLLEYFSRMVEDGVQPDGVTILGVLVGCSHSGLIDSAKRIFGDMESVFGVQRELKHYGCMADLLGRAGLIEEAVEMIEAMPMVGDVFVWGGLLGGCKLHGNVEVAEAAAKHVIEVKPEDGGVYSAMADVYANSQRWDDLVKVRKLKDCRFGIKKNAGCSCIQLNGVNHEFVSGDCLHPHTDDIYTVLNRLEYHQFEAVWLLT